MDERENLPDTADHVGQAAGGITGVVAGAAIGSTAGPIGTLLGGIAGAIGGWWSGRAIAEAAEDITEADEQFYREEYEREGRGSREAAQSAFYLGHVAAANPAYAERPFDEVESELSHGWKTGAPGHGEWPTVRDYAAVGFKVGRERRRRPR
jgi:hypothetical protein